MIVIDIGCASWGNDRSVGPLLEEFQPDILYGFDPGLEWPVNTRDPKTGARVILSQDAAWTHTGRVGFTVANLGGHVDEEGEERLCIDLAEFILDLVDGEWGDGRIVLKMDAEGAEYTLIPHLRKTNADKALALARIEYHCEACGHGIWDGVHPDGCTVDTDWWLERRDATEAMLRCPAEEWTR